MDLDGKYQITSTSSYDGPLEQKSDGITEIKNGQTSRLDENGVLWSSRFTILNDNEVEMIALADPKDSAPDFLLTAPDGSPTGKAVTYKTVLKLSRKGDKIQISGQIEYGADVVFLTMRKVGP